MRKRTKWLFIAFVILAMLISLLNSSLVFVSAAFYRGSLVTNIESVHLSPEEIEQQEADIRSTSTKAILHIVFMIVINILFILFLKFMRRKPNTIGYIGIAIFGFAIAQIIVMLDVLPFLLLSLPNLLMGVILLSFGFINKKSLSKSN